MGVELMWEFGIEDPIRLKHRGSGGGASIDRRFFNENKAILSIWAKFLLSNIL